MWIFFCAVVSLNGLAWYLMNDRLKERNELLKREVIHLSDKMHTRIGKYQIELENQVNKDLHETLFKYKTKLQDDIMQMQATAETFISTKWNEFKINSDKKMNSDLDVFKKLFVEKRKTKIKK